jgi:hypothetical protein
LADFITEQLLIVFPPKVGQSFLHLLDKNIPFRGGGFNINVTKPVYKNIPARLDPTDKNFAQGQWCFDSPGNNANVSLKSNVSLKPKFIEHCFV